MDSEKDVRARFASIGLTGEGDALNGTWQAPKVTRVS